MDLSMQFGSSLLLIKCQQYRQALFRLSPLHIFLLDSNKGLVALGGVFSSQILHADIAEALQPHYEL
jgi:hypothetical protein